MSEAVKVLGGGARRAWQAVQAVVFLVGVAIVAALLFAPKLGLFLLWDVLIPVAPLLLVVAPGLWRNVCPLGTFSLLPAHARASKKRAIPREWQSRLLAVAVLLLLVIVPLRHPLLDRYGVLTGIVLVAVAALALALGFVFDLKSAWCSGLCPVYPVEMLYGSRPVVAVPNVQCRTCSNCVAPCRDSRTGLTPLDAARSGPGRTASLVLVGGFPGFVLGWYLVELQAGWGLGLEIAWSYGLSLGGLVVSLLVFLALWRVVPNGHGLLARVFAALAIAIYYWFKLPVVLGLRGDGSHALVSLQGAVPDWTVWPLRLGMGALLFGLLVGRRALRGWSPRPPMEAHSTQGG